MSRWIFGFRSMGERNLTEIERQALQRRARRLRVRRASLGTLSLLSFLGVILAIAVAAGGMAIAWAGVFLSLMLGAFLLGWASDAEKLALLHRRALRLGTVERFERTPGSPVRRLWNGVTEDDEGRPETRPWGEYWREEERFEERLVRIAGKNPASFESVGQDGVLLFIEGRPVRELIDSLVWEEKVSPHHPEIAQRGS